MKHTKNAVIFLMVMALILTLLAGCDNVFGSSSSKGSSTSGGDGGLGESFTLPAGPIDYLPGDAEVAVAYLNYPGEDEPVYFYTPVDVSDGSFPGMTITAPPSEHLVDWDIFFEGGFDDISFITVSDNNLKIQIIFDVAILKGTDLIEENFLGFIERGDDDTIFIMWFYTDRDVQMSGSTTLGDGDDSETIIINLNFKKGWNRVIFSWDEETKTERIETGPEPSGVSWIYFED